MINQNGIWVEGRPIPDTFVINIGDLLQKLTNVSISRTCIEW
ncbi:hypothetical protein [Mesorhizobium sp. M0130]